MEFKSLEVEYDGDAYSIGSTDGEISQPEKKIVLVTGAAGFIGSHVADMLLARGDKVIAVDEVNDYYDVRLKNANIAHLRSTYDSDSFVMYQGSICNEDFISMVFEKEQPTHICHLAARAGVRPSIIDPYSYVQSNIEGTTRMLDMARKHNCANFVYASSSSVYGCSQEEVLRETDAVDKPVSPYAATKKACELLAYTFHHLYGLNCTGLRFFTVYGPFGRPDMAPFKFIERVATGKTIQQYGDGTTSRDYTYIDDIAHGVVLSIDKPLGCEVINLGNGKPYLLKDFIGLVEKHTGCEAIIEVLPEQPGDVERTCADITKARELLGYDPKTSFEEGIKNTVQWFKVAQQDGLFDKNVEIESWKCMSGRALSNASEMSTSSNVSDSDDLELSSYVEQSFVQCSVRNRRIFSMKKTLMQSKSASSLSRSASGSLAAMIVRSPAKTAIVG